ncbi:MAG TPA: hypothetical protein VFR78_17815, partial [Pyrinomonadaceae bacterium]|nr:hypothetical protein [Pyrinomonadaceae bacterium]
MGGTFENLSERKHSPEGVRSVRESRAELTAEVLALERLHEASTRLWRSQDLHSGLAEILDASILLLGADMGNVQLLNPATRMLEIVAQRGF